MLRMYELRRRSSANLTSLVGAVEVGIKVRHCTV